MKYDNDKDTNDCHFYKVKDDICVSRWEIWDFNGYNYYIH
jgi:hypothetical protein